jgi:hypothetical protein
MMRVENVDTKFFQRHPELCKETLGTQQKRMYKEKGEKR